MPTTLTTNAVEQSTYIITAAFTDETGAAVAPNSDLAWTLSDLAGTVVNSRSAVSIAPATSVSIVLSGDDLAISIAYRDNRRVVTIEGTYNSSAGSNLPIRDQVLFLVVDLSAVT